MHSTSPARTMISLPSIQNLSAPSTIYVSCSFKWLCSGTTQPFFSRTRASIRFSPVIIWRSSSGFSFSNSTSFQRMCLSIGKHSSEVPPARHASCKEKQPDSPAGWIWNLAKLLLGDRNLVIADGSHINLVRQLELGINTNVGIFGCDVFADKVFKRHARHAEPINGHFTHMLPALSPAAGSVAFHSNVMLAAEE